MKTRRASCPKALRRWLPGALICAALAPALASDPDPVGVLESADANRTFTDVAGPSTSIPLTFVERAGKTAVVRLEPVLCISANGNSARATFAEGQTAGGIQPGPVAEGAALSFTLPPHGTHRVFLAATMIPAGTYRCLVQPEVRVGNAKTTFEAFTISVGRSRALPPIDIGAVPAVQETTNWSGAAREVRAEIHVYATGGPVSVEAPRLLSASWRPRSDSATGISTTLGLSGVEPPALEVKPGVPATLALTLSGMGEPGRYDAMLRFAPAGYQPLDTTVTVYVREPVGKAFAIILAGVVASFLMHVYTSSVRPMFQVAQRAPALRAGIERARAAARKSNDAEAGELVDRVEAAIRRKYEDRRLAAGLEAYEEMVPALATWVEVHGQLLAARPVSVRDALMPKLVDARNEFVSEDPDTTRVRAAIEVLNRIPDDIRTEIRKALKAEAQELDTRLRPDTRPMVVELRNLLADVFLKLDADRVEVAAGIYLAVRTRYVQILAQDLRSRVAPDSPPPGGVAAAQWEKIKRDVIQALRGVNPADDQAMDQVKRAALPYVNGLGAALRAADASLKPDDKTKVEGLLDEMDKAIEAGNLSLAWRQLDAAQRAFHQALAASIDRSRPLAESLGAGGAPAPSSAGGPALSFDPVSAFDLAPSWSFLGWRGAAAMTARARLLTDIALSAVVFVVAGAIGVQTLWIDNPTWGGWTAWLTAFLWGFAADQFTYAGVMARLKKI